MFEPRNILPKTSPFLTRERGRRARWVMPALTVAILAILGAGAWLLWGRENAEGTLLTQKIAVGTVEDTVTAMGTLQPLQYVDVGTQVSGQIKVIHVDYGATVQKGELLAEVDPTLYESRLNGDQAQLLNLRAQLAQRQAQRALTELQFKRQQELLKENATSQDAFDSSDSALKVARAQITQLEAQIQQTESTLIGDRANLGYTKIYAPMAGSVVNLAVKQGQTLNANQTAPIVLRIADLKTMTVWAQVSEADVAKLKMGMDAYFTTLGSQEKRRYGKLRQIIPTPEIINNIVLYDCLFDVANPDGDLLTQMSAQVYFIAAQAKDVTVVPMAALRPLRGENGRISRYSARIVTDDGDVETREVELGVTTRLTAEVKSGLKVGEEVVLNGPIGDTHGPQAPPQPNVPLRAGSRR